MFVLGFHFPADMGNVIPDDKVIAKLDEAVDMSGVKEIKLKMGKNRNSLEDITYSKTDTLLAKALVHFFQKDNESKEEKYLVYTDRYQMSELAKKLDKDDETLALCKKFDSMDMFTVEVA
jgi:translation initiation factor 2 beta subunit (eIF-2beta)/eIF-5